MENNLVSVIIPTYKRPDNLTRAIESILNQTYNPIEIIVVDDNGKNTEWQLFTEKKLENYISSGKISYIIHEVNKNGSAARNTGMKNSHGNYINFLDDDDEFLPDKIEKQLNLLKKYPKEFGGCICNTHIKGQHRTFDTQNEKEGNLIQEVLTGKMTFNTSTVLFRREAIEKIKGFDETFKRHQDWELYIRFFRLYKMCLVKDYLLIKYSTPNIITNNPSKSIEYKEKFLNTFKDDIEKMPLHKKIYKHQYELLALTLLSGHNKKDGVSYINKSLRYGIPSFWIIIKYIYYLFLKS